MESSEHLSTFDYLLMYTGVKLYVKTRTVRFLNHLFGIMSIVNGSYLFVSLFLKANTMIEYGSIVYVGTSLLNNICLFLNRGKIADLLDQLFLFMSKEYANHVRRLGILLITMYCTQWTSAGFFNVYTGQIPTLYGVPIESKCILLLVTFLHVVYGMAVQIIAVKAQFLLIICFYTCYKVDLISFNTIRDDVLVRNQTTDQMYLKSTIFRREIRRIKEAFNSTFSLIILSWFVQKFFSTVASIIFLRNLIKVDMFGFWILIIVFAIDAVGVLSVILAINYFNSKACSVAYALADDLTKRPENTIRKQNLITELEKTSFNLNVYDMFDVNNGLILSFCGTVVTFVVLIIQMHDA